MEHRWIYVIIPVKLPEDSGDTFPLFSAWCKQEGCSAYFTQPLDYDRIENRQGRVELPQYGCVVPEFGR